MYELKLNKLLILNSKLIHHGVLNFQAAQTKFS